MAPDRICPEDFCEVEMAQRQDALISRRACMGLLGGAAISLPAHAQQSPAFPNRLMHIIVPFTPGGSNDVVAREMATGLQASLKQSVVVENKPGGGGNIA